MATELTERNGTEIAVHVKAPPIATDNHRDILRGMVDRNATEQQIEMLILIGNRYDLDPILGHIVLIQGKVFVTHKGLIHKAHTSGQFDGLETTYGNDDNGRYCECSVFRKDMSHPFKNRIYIAEYKNNNPIWNKNESAMGAKTAESFTMRRAFDVSLVSQEEMGAVDITPPHNQPRPQIAAPVAEPAKPARSANSRALLEKVSSAAKTLDASQREIVKTENGGVSLRNMTDAQLAAVYGQIAAMNAAKVEAEIVADPQPKIEEPTQEEIEGDPFADH